MARDERSLRTWFWQRPTALRRRARSRGFYTTLLALLLPVFMGFMGLGVDMSHLWWVRGQLQNAADAAAFAGARELNSTSAGRTAATGMASTYATKHSVNGQIVTTTDVAGDETGLWQMSSGPFTTSNVSDPMANALRVTVTRRDVPTFFTRILSRALSAQTVTASAIAVAGGAGQIECGFPATMASCQLTYAADKSLICPTSLSFQSGMLSIGLTHPDGTSSVTGANTVPYFRDVLADPLHCGQNVQVGRTLYLQNGNDLSQRTVDDINAATKNGTAPFQVILPVVDTPCGSSGPNFNSSAVVVGFLKMKLVGAKWTNAAPAAVATACPTLSNKNICVTADCSLIDTKQGGGTIQTSAERIYLVR